MNNTIELMPSLPDLVKQKKKIRFFALFRLIAVKYAKSLLKNWLAIIIGCVVSYIAAFSINIYILLVKYGGLNMGIAALAGDDGIWYSLLRHPAINSGAWAFYFFFFTLISKTVSDVVSRGMKQFSESIRHCGAWFIKCFNTESPNRIRVLLVSAGIAQIVGILAANGPACVSLLLLFFFSFIKREKGFFNLTGCFLIKHAGRLLHWPKVDDSRLPPLSGLISVGFMAGFAIEIVMGAYSGTGFSYLAAVIFIIAGSIPSFGKYAVSPYHMLVATSVGVIAFFAASIRIVSAQDAICSQDIIKTVMDAGFGAIFGIGNSAGISGMAGFAFGSVLGGSSILTESISGVMATRQDTPARAAADSKDIVFAGSYTVLRNMNAALTDFSTSLAAELIPAQARGFIDNLNGSLSDYMRENRMIPFEKNDIGYENIRNMLINHGQELQQYMRGFMGEPADAELFAGAEKLREQFTGLAMKEPEMLKAFIERYAEDSPFMKVVGLAVGDPPKYRAFMKVLGDDYMKAFEALFRPYADLGNEWSRFEALKSTDPAKYDQGLKLLAALGIGDVTEIAGNITEAAGNITEAVGNVPKLFQSINAFKGFAADSIDWIRQNSGLMELVRGIDFFDDTVSVIQKGASLREGLAKLTGTATSLYNHLKLIKTAEQELSKNGQSQMPPHSTA